MKNTIDVSTDNGKLTHSIETDNALIFFDAESLHAPKELIYAVAPGVYYRFINHGEIID